MSSARHFLYKYDALLSRTRLTPRFKPSEQQQQKETSRKNVTTRAQVRKNARENDVNNSLVIQREPSRTHRFPWLSLLTSEWFGNNHNNDTPKTRNYVSKEVWVVMDTSTNSYFSVLDTRGERCIASFEQRDLAEKTRETAISLFQQQKGLTFLLSASAAEMPLVFSPSASYTVSHVMKTKKARLDVLLDVCDKTHTALLIYERASFPSGDHTSITCKKICPP